MISRHPIAKKLMGGIPLAIYAGCDAPDGAIHGLEGEESTLHTIIKKKGDDAPLTLLMFGSQTCPMFMGKLLPACDIIRSHVDSGKLNAFMVYIREAHPTDGWANGADSPFPKIKQTHTMPDRLAAFKAFAKSTQSTLPQGMSIWFDDPTANALDLAYEAPPARLVLVDPQLKVVFSTGQAPLQYDLKKFGAFLVTHPRVKFF
jgi:hypothetical protein